MSKLNDEDAIQADLMEHLLTPHSYTGNYLWDNPKMKSNLRKYLIKTNPKWFFGWVMFWHSIHG